MKIKIIAMGIVVAALVAACTKTEPAPTADYTVKEAGETVRVEVSSSGYSPKSIAVKKGVSVKLAFIRKDSNNCGDELVFPSLNIKKTLPVGENVEVEVKPEQTGEIKFACGMDMLRGKIIVME